MRIVFLSFILFSNYAFASQKIEVILPTDGWYQIQLDGFTLCETDQPIPCLLLPGVYTRINHTTGLKDKNYVVEANNLMNQGVLAIDHTEQADRIAEFYCPDDTFPVALTCYAYTTHNGLPSGNRTTVPTRQEIFPIIDYENQQHSGWHYDWDAACIPDQKPAFIRASLFCAPISFVHHTLNDVTTSVKR